MSISYWAIEGYGVNIEGEIYDLKKVVKELGLDEEDFDEEDFKESSTFMYWGDICPLEIIDTMLGKPEFLKHSKYLSFADTGNGDGMYLYYCPRYPWHMDEEERNITKEEIEQMIVDILLRVTVLSEKQIRENFEDVSTIGWG